MDWIIGVTRSKELLWSHSCDDKFVPTVPGHGKTTDLPTLRLCFVTPSSLCILRRSNHVRVHGGATMAVRDTDVEVRGSALAGRRVVLGVSGGIAAVDTVRIARELRRQGAEITVIMTTAAQRIITPLAVRWATQGEVITDWDGDMEALNTADGVLVVPTTRDTLASSLHGLQNGPLLMAQGSGPLNRSADGRRSVIFRMLFSRRWKRQLMRWQPGRCRELGQILHMDGFAGPSIKLI